MIFIYVLGGVRISLNVEGSPETSCEAEVTIYTYNSSLYTIFIGGVPIVYQVIAPITFGILLNMNGLDSFSASIQLTANVKAVCPIVQRISQYIGLNKLKLDNEQFSLQVYANVAPYLSFYDIGGSQFTLKVDCIHFIILYFDFKFQKLIYCVTRDMLKLLLILIVTLFQ
jgi:hypothetical protein